MLKLICATKCLNNHMHPQIHSQDSLHFTITLTVLHGAALPHLKRGSPNPLVAGSGSPDPLVAGFVSPDPLGASSGSPDPKVAGSGSLNPLITGSVSPDPKVAGSFSPNLLGAVTVRG